MNNKSTNLCDLSLIYNDSPDKLKKYNVNKITSKNYQNVQDSDENEYEEEQIVTKDSNKIYFTNFSNNPSPTLIENSNSVIDEQYYFKEENEEEKISKCFLCNNSLIEGEVTYFCLCGVIYHPYCLIKLLNQNILNQKCPKCNENYIPGVYNIKAPLSYLNSKSVDDESAKGECGKINSTNNNNVTHISHSTNDVTTISLDTNINKLENYEKICEMANDLNAESVFDLIKLDNNQSVISNNNIIINDNDNINNDGNTTPISNIQNMKSHNSKKFTRTPLSPINVEISPFCCKNLNSSSYANNKKCFSSNSNYIMCNSNAFPSNFNGSVSTPNNNNKFKKDIHSNTLFSNENANNNNANIYNNNNSFNDSGDKNVRQHLIFCSNSKNDNLNNSDIAINTNVNNNIINNNNTNNIKQNTNKNYNDNIIMDNNIKQSSNNENESLYSIFENQNNISSINSNSNTLGCNMILNNSNNSNNNNMNANYAVKKLIFEDIDEEVVLSNINNSINNNYYDENEDDKENIPPIPKEYSNISAQKDSLENSLIDMTVTSGISHINSDKQKKVNIPISIDLQINKSFFQSNKPNYKKDILIIINSDGLNSTTVLQLLTIVSSKLGDLDNIYSNILKTNKWLSKNELINIINSSTEFEKYYSQKNILDYQQIINFILFSIDLAASNDSNIFSVLFINDLGEINSDVNYKEGLEKLQKKLEEKKINLIKNFTVNNIILDDLSKNKNEGNMKYISFIFELSLLCLGYFYAPQNAQQLMKAVLVYYTCLEQTVLINNKLIIKGNKDPSIYIENPTYPCIKKSHNYFEIYVGNFLLKEKKIINLNTTIFINSNNFNLSFPLLEVSCQFGVNKNDAKILKSNFNISNCNNENNNNFNYDNNNNQDLFSFGKKTNTLNINKNNNHQNMINCCNKEDHNLIYLNTDYYSLSIPIISHEKDITFSNTVFLRNIIEKTIENIIEGIDLFKDSLFEEAYKKFEKTKIGFDNLIKKKTGMFNILQFLAKNNYSFANMSAIFNTYNNISGTDINMIDESHNNNFNNSLLNFNNNSSNLSISLSYTLQNQNIFMIFNYVKMIFNDLNFLMEQTKNKNINYLCCFYLIWESQKFYRNVILNDDRFIDDNIYLN